MLVTGKGVGKRAFEREIERLEVFEEWEWVRIRTEWLSLEDYPKLLGTLLSLLPPPSSRRTDEVSENELGSGDLGISLHTSTSGLDLPMKVVDMFGCGLPVLALGFEWYVFYFPCSSLSR